MRIILARAATGVASRRARFWIETIALVCGIACALALLFAALGAVAGAAAGEPESGQRESPSTIHPQTFEGLITDTHCGAKHSAAIGMAPAECTRACVHGGAQFALVDGDALYLIEGDPLALKGAAGQRVRISGTLNGKKISVISVAKT
ncbi:MAG: hypothetical protein WAN60_16490 [Candidatus Sulfotelmatobacter sp.]